MFDPKRHKDVTIYKSDPAAIANNTIAANQIYNLQKEIADYRALTEEIAKKFEGKFFGCWAKELLKKYSK